jgi:Invasion associated locus B (IalB) protein
VSIRSCCRYAFGCSALIALVSAGGAIAPAQTGPKSLGTFDAWTAVEMPEKSSKICYMVARPTKSLPEGAKRGDILLTVTHRPAAKQRDEVSFQSGYPYKPGAPVVLEVEKKKFDLFTKPDTDPEGAWSRDAAMDKALIEAMRAGKSLTVKGSSARGTETTDTFSLDGFTKAHAEIGQACGVK